MCVPTVNKKSNNNNNNTSSHTGNTTNTSSNGTSSTNKNTGHDDDDNNNDLATKYQKLAEYPPNKEGTWPYPKEDDGWVHAHNSIRTEMEMLIGAINGIREKTKLSLSTTQVAYIQQAWQCHYDHIHAHHTNEDDLLVPFLETRFHYPQPPHEFDHTVLVAKLESLHSMVTALSPSANGMNTTTTCESLVQALEEYQAMMLPHLLSEEVLCLPLMRAYFTPEEIAPVIQKIMSTGPIIEGGSFIAGMGVEHFRTKFMVQEGIPDFLWEMNFKNQYQHYQENFAKPLGLLHSTSSHFSQHQKLPEYPPNKESTWPYSQEEDGWMHAHNSIRTEIELLIDSIHYIVGKGPLSAVQISYIQQAWQCHYEHVHAHHSNEDELMVPFLSTRFIYPTQPNDHDHAALVAKLETLHTMVADLSSFAANGTTVCTGKALVQTLQDYQAMMLPHLAAEEADSLPLMRAYFTPDEIAPVVQKILNAGPPFEIGSFIACMGVKAFRTKFMLQEGIPDFLWEADFKNRYQYYQENFSTPLDELIKTGGFLEI